MVEVPGHPKFYLLSSNFYLLSAHQPCYNHENCYRMKPTPSSFLRPIQIITTSLLLFALLTGCAAPHQGATPPRSAPAAYGEHGIVASVHPLATQAGLDMLKQGGNAVDAAVAVALTLGVVDGQNSGIGGGCFMLIRRANGSVIAIDGREMAPGKATHDMFIRNGKGDTDLSQTGSLASGVPGAL